MPCAAVGAILWGSGHVVAQPPEARGPHAIEEWDAGRLAAPGGSIPTRVLQPATEMRSPLVAVIHGSGRTGDRHVEMARTFASRGFVVLLPDIPCTPFACNHDENAAQILALLDWAVARGAERGTRLAGRVDPDRRAVVGHSWGALAAHLAAARDANLDAVVLLDPNDDRGVGLAATSSVRAAVAQLLAAVPGACNAAWDERAVHAALSAPRMMLTVTRSGHCDPELPGDTLCPAVCGRGDPDTARWFRRYTVAWVECALALGGATWIGGAAMRADVEAGIVGGVALEGADGLACRRASSPEDGGVGSDAGVDLDASLPTDAAGVAEAGDTEDASHVEGGAQDGADGLRDDGGSDGAVARDAAGTRPDGSLAADGSFDGAAPDAARASAGGGCGCGPSPATNPTPVVASLVGVGIVVARRRCLVGHSVQWVRWRNRRDRPEAR
ncbi:MAG: dienelactone hydrolase family protein [Myxococcota bacterium]|nr:dienelactone hydrolase family protein [Myxococcota bacterium]